MTVHLVKIRSEFFGPVLQGRKTFEVRYNDRNYTEGDILALAEWDEDEDAGTGEWTGAMAVRTIGYVYPLEDGAEAYAHGYVVLALLPATRDVEEYALRAAKDTLRELNQ